MPSATVDSQKTKVNLHSVPASIGLHLDSAPLELIHTPPLPARRTHSSRKVQDASFLQEGSKAQTYID
ncbi:hypothetical protein LINPERHAP1_LOCUS31820, partial [Linum perenne]